MRTGPLTVLMIGAASIDVAIDAIRAGAYDFRQRETRSGSSATPGIAPGARRTARIWAMLGP